MTDAVHIAITNAATTKTLIAFTGSKLLKSNDKNKAGTDYCPGLVRLTKITKKVYKSFLYSKLLQNKLYQFAIRLNHKPFIKQTVIA